MSARVLGVMPQGGIVLDRTVFYATSGRPPGDTGALTTADGTRIAIDNAIYTDPAKTEIAHVPAPGAAALKIGDAVTAMIDWTSAMPACACIPRCICSPPCCLTGDRRLGRGK